MLLRILLAAGLVVSVCVSLATCGDSTAGPGDFCEGDSDCRKDLVCRNNICVQGGSGECDPPCQDQVQTCFQGACVDIANPTDKDGDGTQAGEDCNDFDPTIHPGAQEYCDGVDNNCDGLTDEGCPACQSGEVQPCSTDLGECIAGVQTCGQAGWEACTGSGPQPESCDGLDNDCDGLTDEVCPCLPGDQFPCGAGVGSCAEGTQTCENGAWSGCADGELPQPERCNGADDDCDGTADDGFNLGAPCTGEGECGTGVVECVADLDTICSSMPGGSTDQSGQEVCDGLDNDCDGLSDEGLEADVAPNQCALAQELGGLPDNVDGGSRVTVTGNLWPPGDEDWYKVTASDDLNEDLSDGCDSFHFAIRFDVNPGNHVLDIYTDGCAPEGIACREDDSFNFYYDFNELQGGQPVGQCECRGTDPLTSEEGYNICSEETKTFYVRVHAGPAPVDTCEDYQLTFSNGVAVPVE